MLAAGVSPRLTAYNIMIRSTAKRGLHRAEEWFQRLSAVGHTRDVITWSALIEACGSSSPAAAEKYFRQMVGSGVAPDEFALKTLRLATPECDALCSELGVTVRSAHNSRQRRQDSGVPLPREPASSERHASRADHSH